MNNNKKINVILFVIGVVIISSTLITIHEEKEQKELRAKALSSSDAFNWSALPSYKEGAAVSPKDEASLIIMNEAVNANVISWHELTLRAFAFKSMEQLCNNNNTSEQKTKDCLKIIKEARESRVIEDSEIAVGDDCTIGDMALNGWV